QHGTQRPPAGRLQVSGFPASVDLMIRFDGDAPLPGDYFTDEQGAFSSSLRPGTLGSRVQRIYTVSVTGGGQTARTRYTQTLPAGADFAPTRGTLMSKVRFRVWGFATDGRARTVYVHYVRAGIAERTVRLGRTRGQCGLLRSRLRKLF